MSASTTQQMDLIDEEEPLPLAQLAARTFLNDWLKNPKYEQDEERFNVPILRCWQRAGIEIVKIHLVKGVIIKLGDRHHCLSRSFISELFERTSLEDVSVKWNEIDDDELEQFLLPLICDNRLKVGRACVNVQLWHRPSLNGQHLPHLTHATLWGIYDLDTVAAFLNCAPNVRMLSLSLPHALEISMMCSVREHVLKSLPNLRRLFIKHFYRESQKEALEKELERTLTVEHAQTVVQARQINWHWVNITYQLQSLLVRRPAEWPERDFVHRPRPAALFDHLWNARAARRHQLYAVTHDLDFD